MPPASCLLLAADIADVPADFIKSAMMLFGFVIVIYMQWQNSQVRKREVSGSMTVTEGKEYADKHEVEERLNEIENDIANLQRSNTKEHNESRKAGEDRVHAITQRIADEMQRRDVKLDELRDAITSKIDAFMVLAARHDAQLPQIEHRLDQVVATINETIPRIHQRLDDAIRVTAKCSK